MDHNEKSTTQNVDVIESAHTSEHGHHHKDANEEIIEHLQTTGEDVGMTFRSIMAAVVSNRAVSPYTATPLTQS